MIKPHNENPAGKKEQVRDMFDSIARRYDLLNHLLSMNIDRRWRARVVKMILRQSPESVLDVATGTGDLAIAVGRALPAAALTGVDLSPRMLRIGREKVAARFPGREFPMLEGDAERLPFADASFGAVTCGFGVRNFENLPRGLAEMYRVLRPGGRVYILEFSMPSQRNALGRLYRFYFRHILPGIGRIVSKDARAYTYLPESVGEFPYGERFRTLLSEAGFAAPQSEVLMGGIATIYTADKP
ncbi:bifunctional demethylmenaquinone methyltransferase/2-methoxy-6-polyprenyl-1,4-benzoquinol methylase UbiE [Rikenella microfusus]|uniref:Demethylmenaquinone methyltransferase n=1 Tax=Rikenella microfusus TaxID=28139 RepID=A0A379MTQ4_9BACT|nr:bifunctional demethylmenaquinone methyltransferase/2-methoxy-6-polyprenyl-1,4-benzoquinol methylase UbiE [Rikenella microfusus]SUE35104.1 Demethylmenaquinone methyltransferase [Rikenella microfusus]